MGFMNRLKSFGSKVLKIGGNALRTIGDFGSKAVDFGVKNAGWAGTALGGALTALGMPYLGAGAVAAGNTISKIANNKGVQNVVRGVQDAGTAFNQGSQYLKR